jgi:glyoxylase-like metal-dependent hydrolase (beta-lactamase superfamily II)
LDTSVSNVASRRIATAKHNLPTNQVPGLYHKRVGDVVLTAAHDGYFDAPPEFFTAIDAADVEELLLRAHRPKLARLPINSFVVNDQGRLTLIDTGCGASMGPTLGKLAESLKAAGIAPEDIATVLVTHIHPDHTNGLVNADGAAMFPNAEVVVHEAEFRFWLDEENRSRAPEQMKDFFDSAVRAFGPYRDRIRQFTQGEVLPGIEAVPLYGHTPGHTGFLIHSSGDQLLVWGDVVHSLAVQLPRPEASFASDVDQTIAADTRKKILDRASADRLQVTGMHLDFPGFGYVDKTVTGYSFVPETWSPTL